MYNQPLDQMLPPLTILAQQIFAPATAMAHL